MIWNWFEEWHLRSFFLLPLTPKHKIICSYTNATNGAILPLLYIFSSLQMQYHQVIVYHQLLGRQVTQKRCGKNTKIFIVCDFAKLHYWENWNINLCIIKYIYIIYQHILIFSLISEKSFGLKRCRQCSAVQKKDIEEANAILQQPRASWFVHLDISKTDRPSRQPLNSIVMPWTSTHASKW